MSTRLVSLSPAEPGWRAVYDRHGASERTRVIAWGLTEDGTTVGLVLDPTDPTRIVPAAQATGPGSTFERYGFKEP